MYISVYAYNCLLFRIVYAYKEADVFPLDLIILCIYIYILFYIKSIFTEGQH